VAIITYIPYEPLNVSASFTNPFPNYTNSEYTGTNKDGSFLRGIVWVDNITASEVTLYISVVKTAATEYAYFGLNIEMPDVLTNYPVESRYEKYVEVEPWQTKWLLVNFPEDDEQFFSAFRGEFCDEPQGEATLSLIFQEAVSYDESGVINPCGCDDYIVETRDANLISRFTGGAQQMYIMPSAVSSQPVYAGMFYQGPDPPPSAAYAKHTSCPESTQRRTARAHGPSLRDDDGFTFRLSLYGQELFPTVRTKYTKPDRVNNDLLANIDDTPYCDFWSSLNFTGYVSDYQYRAFDSACFLERYPENFTIYNFETLVGENENDKVLVLSDFYEESENNDTFFNIVHSNEDCGSYAYFYTQVPAVGWELESPKAKEKWTSVAIGMVVLFGFLFAVFFLSSILLISRLREYTRYRKIGG